MTEETADVEAMLAKMDDSAAFFTRLAMSKEPLHPDLAPWLSDIPGVGFKALRHPLVYSVPYTGPGIPNYSYKVKRETEAEYIEKGKWTSLIWLYERPYRLQKLVEVGEEMSDQDYWEMVSAVWTDSENIHQNLDVWAEIFESDRPGREHLMAEHEQEEYERLPETVTIYRGCHVGLNEDGMSWTLDKERALWFARRFAGDDASPSAVRTATTSKDNIVAVFLGRNENEVVVGDIEAVTETGLEIL